jgi:hypothetical protein
MVSGRPADRVRQQPQRRRHLRRPAGRDGDAPPRQGCRERPGLVAGRTPARLQRHAYSLSFIDIGTGELTKLTYDGSVSDDLTWRDSVVGKSTW